MFIEDMTGCVGSARRQGIVKLYVEAGSFCRVWILIQTSEGHVRRKEESDRNGSLLWLLGVSIGFRGRERNVRWREMPYWPRRSAP